MRLLRRLLALGAAFCVADESADCDLKPWVSESLARGEEGFHVLCVYKSQHLRLYRGGVATDSPLELEWQGAALRDRLSQSMSFKDTIRYTAKGKKLEWKKQPWVLFTAKGKELRPGAEGRTLEKHFGKEDTTGTPVTLLLFEGGVWRWPTIQVGYIRRVLKGVYLRTVSRLPALFEVYIDGKDEVPDLTPDLLSNAIDIAGKRMAPSMTEGKVDTAMRSSDQAFVPYSVNDKLRLLEKRTGALLRAPAEQLEHLQVLRYQEGQHYDAHRDYWDPREFPDIPRFRNAEGFWHQRHATLLWYLQAPEAGGETWFPRAHGGPIPWNEWTACDGRGAKVSPANATAVLFYSLQADGDIDEMSWHCGCPVERGVKWAANSWLSNSPKGTRDKGRRPVKEEL